MGQIEPKHFILGQDELILVTGATGFIGPRVVRALLDYGFRNLRCLARPTADIAKVKSLTGLQRDGARVEVMRGNLLNREDCLAATEDVALILHLAAARGEKSFPEAFLNSVVTTRNLLEATLQHKRLRRFVNVSSFAVYTNTQKPRWRLLDELCPVERHPELRSDAYAFAKARQDDIVVEYGKQRGIPYVIVRPGYVFGAGNTAISGRVGVRSFGFFLHLGGSNRIPFTYVDNCTEAIVLAGVVPGIEGEVFNVVDDDLPTSRGFLRLYKRNVRRFKSLYLPHLVSYGLCYLWEKYSVWSQGQLPPVYTRRTWHAFWKKTRYSNDKLKTRLGWLPKVPMTEALDRYFDACRAGVSHA